MLAHILPQTVFRKARKSALKSLTAAAAFIFTAFTHTPAAQAQDAVLDIVSAPNPHVFPLLIALKENPDLPVKLHPISGGKEIETEFAEGADALLAMTYVGAKQRHIGAAPDLKLVAPTTWRGFWQVAGADVSSFADLKGQTVVVSGPAGGGQGGGGDIIFRAAVKRQGVDPDTDLNVVYAPVKDAQKLLESGEAAAIAVPAPASTGFNMNARIMGSDMTTKIDFQSVFSGYASFPQDQLPLGGLHATGAALADPVLRQALQDVMTAYTDAARKLEAEPVKYARIASSEFSRYYADTGAPTPPAMVLAAAVKNGDLVYRTDIPLSRVESDLAAWLEELLGYAPDAGFFAADLIFSPPAVAGAPAPERRSAMRAAMRDRMMSRMQPQQ